MLVTMAGCKRRAQGARSCCALRLVVSQPGYSETGDRLCSGIHPPSSPLLRHPLEQVTRLNVKRRAQPIERIDRETAELQLGVGEAVRGRHRESRFPGETVRGPPLSCEDRGEIEADHGIACRRARIIPAIIIFANSNTRRYYPPYHRFWVPPRETVGAQTAAEGVANERHRRFCLDRDRHMPTENRVQAPAAQLRAG
jgi:hypothetical protein